MNTSLEQLFRFSISKNASDLHIAAGSPPVLRIDGVLELQSDLNAFTPQETEELCYSILTPDQKQKFLEKRELDVGYSLSDGTRFRINLHWERNTAGLVARIISADVPNLKDLFMPPITESLMEIKRGLIIITGPTGSGKSTSMAAMIDYVNQTRAEHIVTMEDPIEYVFKNKKSIIRQRQLGDDVLSFGEGLKHVVRQDPNVIMVGEMRDLETIAAAITLAETGHLVLTTLHTSSAIQTIDRIIDVFPPYQQGQVRLQLSSVLRAVMTKWLLPRVAGGRIPAYEVLLNTPAVSTLIRENQISQIKTILQTSARQGMITMEQALTHLREQGEVSQETLKVQLQTTDNLESKNSRT